MQPVLQDMLHAVQIAGLTDQQHVQIKVIEAVNHPVDPAQVVVIPMGVNTQHAGPDIKEAEIGMVAMAGTIMRDTGGEASGGFGGVAGGGPVLHSGASMATAAGSTTPGTP